MFANKLVVNILVVNILVNNVLINACKHLFANKLVDIVSNILLYPVSHSDIRIVKPYVIQCYTLLHTVTQHYHNLMLININKYS